ncbi:dehydratase [Oceanicola sp. 22II-s10i]|nr:dehydratase [Oceanicola sp. 22II-s10i]
MRDHRFGPSRYLEDFELGEEFYIPSRTMTSALFAAFQLASGDNDPIHYDVEYCKARGHRSLLAHGMQVLIQTAAGAGVFPHQVADSLVALIEITGRPLKPVYMGDTLYPRLRITEITPQTTTGVIVCSEVFNQDSVKVFDGTHRYLIRKRPSATRAV